MKKWQAVFLLAIYLSLEFYMLAASVTMLRSGSPSAFLVVLLAVGGVASSAFMWPLVLVLLRKDGGR